MKNYLKVECDICGNEQDFMLNTKELQLDDIIEVFNSSFISEGTAHFLNVKLNNIGRQNIVKLADFIKRSK